MKVTQLRRPAAAYAFVAISMIAVAFLHLRAFAGYQDVEIAYVCDPDENRRNTAASTVEKATGKKPKAEKDMRQVFEDKAVDAAVIATPDH